MRHIFLGCCVILLVSTADVRLYAQRQVEVDSLLDLLVIRSNDSSKVLVYDRLSYMYNFVQYKTELARKYADSARLLSEKLDYQPGVISSHYSYGMIDMNEGNYSDALRHFNVYIEYFSKVGDSLKVAKGLYCIGIVYNNLGDDDKNLAIQFRILKIYERENNKSSAAHTMNSIAGTYWRTHRYKDAIVAYNKANEIYNTLGNKARYGMGLQNLANVYVSMKKYDSARQFYAEALRLIRDHGSDAEIAYILGNLGDLYEELNDYDQALSYNLQALNIRRKLSQKKSLAVALVGVGHMYSIMNLYPQAEKYLTEGMTIARAIGSKNLLQESYLELSDMFAAKNDFKKAYSFKNLSDQWKDSIYNEESIKQVNELQAKYETLEKDKQITVLAKENEIKDKEAQRQSTLKQAFIGGFVLVIILTGLITYTFRQRLQNQRTLTAKNKEISEINFRHQLGELEMKALRAQINPHFLFNCMNSINRMILNGETESASLYLTKFSKLVRLVLENAESTRVSLGNELTLLESYIQLEELRFKGKIRYEISVDESIEKESTYLPSMVLQPFVENAIWHGLMHKGKDEKGIININIKEEDDRLLCIIEDNGVGREKAKELREKSVLKNKSMGMKITEERLRLLSRERLEQLIRITDLKDALNHALGTRVEINIPIS